jgi:TolB-like protein
MSDRPSFFAELKRRNVYKVAVAYAIVAWLLIQIATQVFPFFEIPNWAVRLVVLAWAFELTPEGIKRTEDVDLVKPSRARGRGWIYVAIIAGALSIGLFFLGRYTTQRRSAGEDGQAGVPSVTSKSVAVLPFDNLSSDKENAFFAQGIQDEIITTLSKISGLRVISRTSTARYKSAPENLPEIARDLRVSHILEGSVQKAGDRVHINVQLIQAENDAHLWAQSYDRQLIDLWRGS